MRWKVGVLRTGIENIDWTAEDDEETWTDARQRACDELQWLVVAEGVRQEYRMQVGPVPVLMFGPGLDTAGRLDLADLTEGLLPADVRRANCPVSVLLGGPPIGVPHRYGICCAYDKARRCSRRPPTAAAVGRVRGR